MDNELRHTAAALLARLNTITTEDFSRGGDLAEREALRRALAGDEETETDLDGPWDLLLLERLAVLPEELRAGFCELAAVVYGWHYPAGERFRMSGPLLDLWVNVGLALGGRVPVPEYRRAHAAEAQTPRPDQDTLEEWEAEGIAEALDGCIVEPDGHCEHGSPSWLLHLGLI